MIQISTALIDPPDDTRFPPFIVEVTQGIFKFFSGTGIIGAHMIEIKHATESDAQTLAELGRSTFIETFAKDNRQEDMDMYLAKTFGLDIQREEIRDPNRIIEIAWSENQPAGFLHLLMNGETDPSVKGERPIELLRLYVDSKWHGHGAGAALMDRCLSLARDGGFKTIWLGVWERNFRAQAFYKKHGFEVVGQHIFRLGTDDQLDLIMARSL
ncbi:MAG: GNAT family N-acetyltransferase [Bdellovibrionota bacterium]